jgi:hypothetical protein
MMSAISLLLYCAVVAATTITSVKKVGGNNTRVVVIDEVLPMSTYLSLRNSLREIDFVGGTVFPGLTAPIHRTHLDSILSAILPNQQLTSIYPEFFFQKKEFVRGFASILCDPGWIHEDNQDTEYEGEVAPAAVFYFGFDGTSQEAESGTAFYRENAGSFEEMYRVVGVPNRLVIYPSDLLHNAFVESGSLPCSSKLGRMAISLFFLSRHGVGREIIDDSAGSAWRAEATKTLSIR